MTAGTWLAPARRRAEYPALAAWRSQLAAGTLSAISRRDGQLEPPDKHRRDIRVRGGEPWGDAGWEAGREKDTGRVAECDGEGPKKEWGGEAELGPEGGAASRAPAEQAAVLHARGTTGLSLAGRVALRRTLSPGMTAQGSRLSRVPCRSLRD